MTSETCDAGCLHDDGNLLGPGDMFGEVCLVCSVPRLVTVRAKTHTDIFTLSRSALEDAMTRFPDAKREITTRSAMRFGAIISQMTKRRSRGQSMLQHRTTMMVGKMTEPEVNDRDKDAATSAAATSAAATSAAATGTMTPTVDAEDSNVLPTIETRID